MSDVWSPDLFGYKILCMKRLPPAAMRAPFSVSETTDHVGVEDRSKFLLAALPSGGDLEVGSLTMSGANRPPSSSARCVLRDTPSSKDRPRRPNSNHTPANGHVTPSGYVDTKGRFTTVHGGEDGRMKMAAFSLKTPRTNSLLRSSLGNDPRVLRRTSPLKHTANVLSLIHI